MRKSELNSIARHRNIIFKSWFYDILTSYAHTYCFVIEYALYADVGDGYLRVSEIGIRGGVGEYGAIFNIGKAVIAT